MSERVKNKNGMSGVDLYEAVLRDLPVGVFVTDERGRAYFVNDRFRELSGLSTLPTRGSDWVERVHPAHRQRILRAWERATAGQQKFCVEAPLGPSAGPDVSVEVCATPFRDRWGRPGGYVGTVYDVTEHRHLGRDVESERVRGETTERRDIEAGTRTEAEPRKECDRRKDEFLAMLSHELRNPLAALVAANEALRRTSSGRKNTEELEAVFDRQLKGLIRIVNDLLDVARITRGTTVLEKKRFELLGAMRAAVRETSPVFEMKNHALTLEVERGSFCVLGNRSRLRQVFSNLLANAAKYTPPGGHVRIEVRHERTREQRFARIEICDNGRGIAPEILPHVFELFVQSDESLHRSEGGLGIGLALVRSIVEHHGGTVTAASAGCGKGARFALRLPLSEAESAYEGVERSRKKGSARQRIVLVEDNVDVRETLKELLEGFGHRVDAAGDGPTGRALIERLKPDVAILDIGLPGMDGYEVARRVRAAPELSSVRLVAVSGYGDSEARRRTREAGFSAHLTKPAAFADLLEALR